MWDPTNEERTVTDLDIGKLWSEAIAEHAINMARLRRELAAEQEAIEDAALVAAVCGQSVDAIAVAGHVSRVTGYAWIKRARDRHAPGWQRVSDTGAPLRG